MVAGGERADGQGTVEWSSREAMISHVGVGAAVKVDEAVVGEVGLLALVGLVSHESGYWSSA